MSSSMALQFLFDISDQDAQVIGKAADPWAAAIAAGKAKGYGFTSMDLALAVPLAEATRTSVAKRELLRLLQENVK